LAVLVRVLTPARLALVVRVRESKTSMIGDGAMRDTQGFLVLADISGYTQFVRAHSLKHVPLVGKKMRITSEQHAETVITDLLEVIIETMGETMTVNKLEGDAVFFVRESSHPEDDIQGVVEKIMAIFKAFEARLHELVFCQTCLCDCCQNMMDLKVKVIAHFAPFWVKKVAHFEEVAGEGVILVHRLMKNDIRSDEYLLWTQEMTDLAQGHVDHVEFDAHRETTDLGSLALQVHYPKTKPAIPETSPMTWLTRLNKMYAYFQVKKTRKALREQILT